MRFSKLVFLTFFLSFLFVSKNWNLEMIPDGVWLLFYFIDFIEERVDKEELAKIQW